MKKWFLLLLIFILLLIGFFPFIASTTLGKPFFIQLIKTKVKGDITIEKLDLSWLGPQRFENISLANQDVSADVALITSNVPFWKLSHLGNSFTLQDGTFSFSAYEGAEITNVQALINGNNLKATGSTPQGGSLSIRGTIQSDENFDITADLKQIPTIAIDQLLKLNGLAYKTLGMTLNANGACTFTKNQGSISMVLTSPNFKGSINAAITNGILTLNEPLNATLQVSKELTEVLLQHTSDKIITGLETKNPFILRILTPGFSCPIKPFRFDQLEVGAASLDLGQVRVQSGESLHFLVKLFKNKDFGKNIDIWFTPVAFQIQNGVIELGRMDALLSRSIHLCTWGDIDVKKDKLHMFLGLPADTLQESFGIQTLSRNYVLKIPVHGSLNNPKFDTGPAIAKIATMTASQQIPTKGGKIFGGIVNVFTQAQDDGDAPPPNRPFPWER